MEIDKNKFVPLEEIPEMGAEQRTWLKEKCNVEKGYFEPETGKFVITKFS